MQRTHSFKVSTSQVKDQEYKMEIPTAGQLIAIERAKANLTGGDYRAILASNTVGSSYALDVVDMTAYLTVLCPQLFDDLKVQNLIDLDIFDMKQLFQTWQDNCIPWVNDWQQVLREKPDDKKMKKASKKSSGDDAGSAEE
jgi:hypothetical protein